MRRTGSLFILVLASLLSVFPSRIVLLPRQPQIPMTRNRPPRTSRAELPGATAASLLERKRSGTPSGSTPDCSPEPLVAVSVTSGRPDRSRQECPRDPDYLKPFHHPELLSDLPPPAESL